MAYFKKSQILAFSRIPRGGGFSLTAAATSNADEQFYLGGRYHFFSATTSTTRVNHLVQQQAIFGGRFASKETVLFTTVESFPFAT